MIPVWPTVNAALNLTSAVLLSAGFWFIRHGRVPLHWTCMGFAFLTSTIFLVSYLTYHAEVGSVRYTGQGAWRTVYFAILISHSILAAVIVPLILRTLYLVWKGRFAEHKVWARWTWPMWMYVSVTGVVIYGMLYGGRW
jgi:putative membrane protein